MVKIIWTELSLSDLKEIFDYIAANSQRYAIITTNKIYQRVQILADNPYTGKIVDEFNNKVCNSEHATHNYSLCLRATVLNLFTSAFEL